MSDELLVLGLRGLEVRFRRGGQFLHILEALLGGGDLRLTIAEISFGLFDVLAQLAEIVREIRLLILNGADFFFDGLATRGERLDEQMLRPAMFGGGEKLASAFVAVFDERGDGGNDLRFVRFDGFERLVAILEA